MTEITLQPPAIIITSAKNFNALIEITCIAEEHIHINF